MKIDQVIEDMLEFGLPFETIEVLAPHILRLENDPRGFASAFLESEPLLSERLGVSRRH
jgi:hypothetical protein